MYLSTKSRVPKTVEITLSYLNQLSYREYLRQTACVKLQFGLELVYVTSSLGLILFSSFWSRYVQFSLQYLGKHSITFPDIPYVFLKNRLKKYVDFVWNRACFAWFLHYLFQNFCSGLFSSGSDSLTDNLWLTVS